MVADAVLRNMDELKREACAFIDQQAELLLELSHDIHAHPELNYDEHHAHAALTDVLASSFSEVRRGAYGLDTAFEATAGVASESGPHVAIICEYDALPEIGHACGHNVIAAAGAGAGLALRPLMGDLGGTLHVYGTPAEEGGGGKIAMARAGAFRGLDAAMMIHPADHDLTSMRAIAIHECCASFHGQEAHAAAAPHLGRNALDAAVLSYNAIAALRQHIRPTERIHGVFTHGGDKANIVPKFASMNWYVRSDTLESLAPLKDRVAACFAGAAAATGCSVDLVWEDHSYADMRDSEAIVSVFVSNAASIGRDMECPTSDSMVVGSTDMGNLSYLAPSIHPMLRVAPPGVAIHTGRFADYAKGPEGDRAVLDGAKILAMTTIDLLCSSELRSAAHGEFATIGTPPAGVL
jgi:amidohydrolase